MKFNAVVFRKLTGHQHRIKSIEAKSLKHVYLRVNKSSYFLNFFAPHSVRTTIARITIWWLKKNCKWSRIHIFFYKNLFRIFATSRAITKAHHPANFTIFHCRMSSRQPAWPVSATPECLHTLCWHSCSCSSYKTIPFLTELAVTQRFSWFGLCFDWLHSGLSNNGKDQLQRKMLLLGVL